MFPARRAGARRRPYDSTDDDDADATSASGGNLGKVRVYALPAFSTWRTAWDAANN